MRNRDKLPAVAGREQRGNGGGPHGSNTSERVDRVFVYGTFRAGQPARAMIAAHIRRAAPATTAGLVYALPEGYPALVPGSSGTVVGEVLELDDLPATFALFDAYEGEDFIRTLREVQLADGPTTWAWCYELRDPTMVARTGTLVPNGDWLGWHQAGGPTDE